MKKIYFLFLLALLPIAVYADAVEIDGIYYNLTAGNNTAEVTSNPNKYSGVVSIPATVTYGNVEYNVTAIGDDAFSGCSGITSLTIPNSVISIGESIFSGCSGLTSLNVEKGNTKYDSRENCNAIIETKTNTLISGTNNTIIPNSVTSIGKYAFRRCSGLTSITIPNSVTSIDFGAFFGCSGLTSVTIPNSVTSIGLSVFADCSGLTSLKVEAGNTNYDSRDNCNAIIEKETNTLISGTKNTIIPNSVTIIGNNSFYRCTGLTSVTIPNSVTTIDDGAFLFCSGLTSVTIPNSVTSIGKMSFSDCSSLTEIVIGNSVTSIDNHAFQDCNSLTSVNIPNSVTSIGIMSFFSCSGLTSVTIPSSMTSIGDMSFQYCGNLTSVTIEAKGPITISENVFTNRTNATLYVPAGTKADYEAADYWKEFGTILESSEGQTSKTIYVETAGTLPSLISDDEKYTIEELTLTGELNGTDFRLLRDMSGNNYLGQKTEGKLRILDLSGASIVAGGDMFMDTDILSSDDHTMGGPFHFYIEKDNVWPNYIVTLCKFEKIILPNNLSEIGFWAFRDCLSLEEIIIPKSVVKIDDLNGTENPFQSCPKLKKIVVDGDNENYTTIDGVLFDKSVSQLICYPSDKSDESYVVPKSVKEIDAVAFVKCKATSIVIPEGVERLKRYTFYSSENLETISLPNSLTVIDDLCFNLCTSLRNISLPSKLRTISDGAFFYCLSLTSIVIPSTVESIAIGAFSYCNSMASISVEAGNNVYDSRNNCNAIIEKESNRLIVGCSSTLIPNDVLNICNGSFTGNLGLTSISIPNSVLEIGSNAFSECRNLASVELPNSINVIGSHAFAFTSLSSVSIPENVTCISDYTFGSCTKLESVKLPNNLSEIQADAFNSCWKLKLIEIPSSVSAIGEKAFYACKGLSTVISNIKVPFAINENVFSNRANAALYVPVGSKAAYEAADYWKEFKEIKESDSESAPAHTGTEVIDGIYYNLNADYTAEVTKTPDDSPKYFGDITIPASVTYNATTYNVTAIGKFAFYKCKELTSVTIPNSVTSIGYGAFASCSGLTSITIPNSVIEIQYEAFMHCTGITSIELPSSIKAIDGRAFSGCNITTVTIPSSVTNIAKKNGENPFGACNNLVSIKVESGNTVYDSRNNCNAIIETATNELIGGCKTTIIPNSVTSIGYNSMCGFRDLTSITIPSSVTRIAFGAFQNTGLISVTIPNSVTSIGEYAFYDCSSLTSVTVEAKTPINILENVFANKADATLYVPVGCKADYEAADYWKDFGAILESFEGSNFTAKTAEGWDMVFTVLDEDAKTCQVGDIDSSWESSWNEVAVDRGAVNGPVTIPQTVEGYTVVKIGKYAFYGTYGMTSVTIPNTVTAIDEYAFDNCKGLTSIELPASVTNIEKNAFSWLTSATSIKVAEGNQNYDSRDNCNAIIETATKKLLFGCKNTKIPASVTEIGSNAFYYILYNSTLLIPSTITKIDDFAFSGNIQTLQVEHTTPLTISENVFQNLQNSTLRVPAGCKAAYAAATGWSKFSTILEGNEGSSFTAKTTEGINMVFTILDESAKTCQVGYIDEAGDKFAVDRNEVEGPVTIPETVEGYTVVKIGRSAFYNIYRMTSVTIPNTVTAIDETAFMNCIGLISFELPASVTNIGDRAFSWLNNATSIKVAEGNTKYDSRDNCNAIIETATNKLLFGCKNTIIPASVTEIGSNAFLGVLYNTLLIPSTITKIDDHAFSGNMTLQVEHTTPLVISEYVFQDLQNSTLRVPAGCKAAYAAATGWNKFSTIMEGNEGSSFIAKTTEGWDMVFTILDENAKTCQVGYLDGSWDKRAVDRDAVNGAVTIPETVEGYTVKKIGKYAFDDIDGIKTISIPETVTSIDDYAFFNCDQISSFELPASVTNIGTCALAIPSLKVAEGNPKYDSRDNCNAIIETATNIIVAGCRATTIPATASEIGSYAFYGLYDCSIFLPSTITKIGDYAFGGNRLNLQVESAEPLEINENVFINVQNSTLRVPAGCKAAYAAATGWKNFETILEGNEGSTFTAKTAEGWDMVFTILDETKKTCQVGYLDGSWDKRAVDRETVSGSVTIPEKANNYTVVKIGKWALTGIKGMTSVTIPNTVTSIDEFAFRYCGLTSFELPANVTYVGRYALSALSNVTSVKVAEGNPNYDSRDNCNAIIETATNILQFGYKISTIPASVKELGINAFYNLYDCTLTIPSTITKIGDAAFDLNGNLSLQVEHTTPLVINENVFNNLSNSTLHVPAGCKAAYAEATGWNKFSTIIEDNKVSKNVATAGTLSQLISDDEKLTITDLTITGQLNGTDFRLLREMAGSDYQGHATNGQLMKLDISGANIVAGGDKYFESDGLYDEYGNMQYGFGQHSVTTRDNVIGDCLFAGCSKLEEIKIPENIIEIGEYAFMRTNISSFDIPETVEKVALPFFYATRVSTLHIPKNVTTLTASYFMGNQATLSSITVDVNNAKFDSRNNCNAIIEKESNTLILGCKNTTVPDGVTSIGEYAFSYNYGYTSITLPTSVTSLQEGAFFASGLASISLPSALKRIEFNALAYTNISSITIPASVEYIGQGALRACSNLAQITVEAENTVYDSREDCNAIIETATNTLIQGCKTSTIPATVTAIGNKAFQECHDLANITIPSSVTSIADFAFSYCNNLTSVSVEAKTPLVITGNTFTNRANATLYVPAGCKAAYEAADYWKEFKEIIDTEPAPDPVVSTNDKITVEALKTYLGKTSSFSINLENAATDFTAYQFDLTLPEGITLAKNESNKFLVTKTSRYADDEQSLTITQQEGNTYRILCFSMSNSVITGANGAILNAIIDVSSTMSAATYEGMISNIIFTKVDGTQVGLNEAKFNIVVNSYILGDANNDGTINVSDIVEIVNYIMNNPSSRFVKVAADINEDGDVNVTDIVKVVSVIMSNGHANSRGAIEDEDTSADYLTLSENGDNQLSLSINNKANYVASQFVVSLSEGMTLDNISLNNRRCGDHVLVYSKENENKYKVLIYSLTNSCFVGNDGELLNIKTSGNGNVNISDIIFVTCDIKNRIFSSIGSGDGTTSIERVETSEMMDIYSIDGRLIRRQTTNTDGLPKGIYIINGKKRIVK